MAELHFQNRSQLIDLMVDTLNRLGSTVVKDRCASWIALHEAGANRMLRDRGMVQEATATLSGGRIKLPPDWREIQSFECGGKPLDPLTPAYADQVQREGRLTHPVGFVIVGNNLEIVPATTEPLPIKMVYYRKVPALTADAPTNWLLEQHPDYYFYGALVHSAPYLRDDERIATWGALASAAESQIIEADERARFSGSRLKTRARLRNR